MAEDAATALPQLRSASRSYLPRYLVAVGLVGLALILNLQLGSDLAASTQLALILGAEPQEFADFEFLYAALPRAALAVMVGAVMALVGSLLQQFTQNRLLSPMTIGASSGAWLALVTAGALAPSWLADYGAWIAMAGALSSVGLVVLIAGRQGVSGLPVILAGMAIHILLGALASAILLLDEGMAHSLFIWGAGDLTQTDWRWVDWLAPKLVVAVLLLALAPRPLALLRLGEAGAQGRGLAVAPVLILLLCLALWLVASAITAVGVISFVGLLVPNMARSAGARLPLDELLFSMVLGAALLLFTDAFALVASAWAVNVVPSGTAAALIGAPALIWFARRRLTAADQAALRLPPGAANVRVYVWWLCGAIFTALAVLSLFYSPELVSNNGHLGAFAKPSELLWSLRWPRAVTATVAGVGMAVAGLILQRLIRNPLASPDLLGMSAGATLALVLGSILWGASIYEIGPWVAFAGSSLVLIMLVALGRRHDYAAGIVILLGISVAALMDALVNFALARGGAEVYQVLGWLSGSTYRVSASLAGLLTMGVAALYGLALLSGRWLTLIGAGDEIALGRGLDLKKARVALLALVSGLCALVTAVMGPVAFIGLLAPHVAVMLGARKAMPQLVLAPLIGGMLMLFSDWLGRSLLYPAQLPAGTVAAVIGGSYFIVLLARRRLT